MPVSFDFSKILLDPSERRKPKNLFDLPYIRVIL